MGYAVYSSSALGISHAYVGVMTVSVLALDFHYDRWTTDAPGRGDRLYFGGERVLVEIERAIVRVKMGIAVRESVW